MIRSLRFALLFLTALMACTGARAAAAVGQPAPELSVPELDGKPFVLADHRGHVVIVNFWATWCGPCRQEMPALDAFYRQNAIKGIDMIGVSADRAADKDKVMATMTEIAYPAAMMSDARANGFGAPEALPMTYVIDTAGVVRAELNPGGAPVTDKSLNAAVLPLLSARHVP